MTPDKARQLGDELCRIAASIAGIGKELKTLCGSQGCGETRVEQELPVPEPTPTLEEVRAILAEKSRAGHTAAVREIILRHGANKLSEVSTGEYPALLKEAEALK